MPPTRIFLGTSDAFPSLAAQRLLRGSSGLPDFGNTIVVVPGTFAGAALQECLAENAPHGLLMPQIMTPGVFLHSKCQAANTPGQLENELIWNYVATTAARSGNFDLLFPGAASDSIYSGNSFSRLRLELAAGGFSISDVQEHLGPRGSQLAELEKLYLEELRLRGFDDRLQTDLAAAESVEAAADADRIILAGLTDIPRLLRKKLEKIDSVYPGKIEIWIQAEPSDSSLFDEFGSAVAENWRTRPIAINDFESKVSVTSTIETAAEKIKKIFESSSELVYDDTVLILGDMTLYPVLKQELASWAEKQNGELELYDPSGIAFSELRLHKLGCALAGFIRNSDSYEAAERLIREQDFLNFTGKKTGYGENLILNQLDIFRTSSYPDEFVSALKLIREKGCDVLDKAFSILENILKEFGTMELPEFLRKFFTDVYAHRNDIDNTLFRGVPFTAECRLLKTSLNTLSVQDNIAALTDKKELLDMFWKILGQEKLATVPAQAHITVQGCLEIPYIHHKNIIFCGINSKCYPDKIAPTTFLTDAKRRMIGIRSDKDTFARAASHFHALCAQSGKNRNLNLIVIKNASDSEPLQPSPLFFSGNLPPQELMARARHLYPEQLEKLSAGTPAPECPKVFRLKPQLYFKSVPDYPDVPALSITDFKAYISDPMAFFLQRVRDANDTDYLADEPDNAIFGTLCHEVLQMLGNAVFNSAQEYERQLKNHLNQVMRQHFGSQLPPLLRIVHDNLEQRLEHAAEVLFNESRLKGFVPLETEYTLGGETGYIPFCYPDGSRKPAAVLKGKIDRIEYCAKRNLIRIIDYKTGKEDNVEKSHCVIKRDKATKQLTSIRFSNLQLPLYARLLRMDESFAAAHNIDMQNVSICCAYLVIPANVTETAMLDWEAEKLNEIMPFVDQKVYDTAEEISCFKAQMMSEKAEKGKLFSDWFLPEIKKSAAGIIWSVPKDEEYRVQ